MSICAPNDTQEQREAKIDAFWDSVSIDSVMVLNTSHYRAKMFIPCLVGRCPGRMQLHFVDKFNRPLKQAFYRCEREGCYHRDEVVLPEDLNARYVMEASKKRHYKSDETRTRDEMETML